MYNYFLNNVQLNNASLSHHMLEELLELSRIPNILIYHSTKMRETTSFALYGKGFRLKFCD